jgi:nitrile hydratase
MSRHSRERQHPIDYLKHTYYENWLAGLGKLLVETGLITEQELATGKAEGRADKATLKRVPKTENIAGILAKGNPVMMDIDAKPRFKQGDKVRATNQHPKGHTREPRYVRGRTGAIHEHHGAHIFPDKNSEGLKEGHHLYSVRFEAETLWGEDAANRGAIYVDLWEDYLEPVK